MNSEQYIAERLQDQLDWYDKKSIWNQKRYKKLRFTSISVAIMIPFLTGLIATGNENWLKILVALSGVIVAVIEGVLGLYKFQENWIQYRGTAESLKHEKYLFLTGSEPYNTDQKFELLVKRVEYLISKEHSNWLNQNLDNKKGSTDNGPSKTDSGGE